MPDDRDVFNDDSLSPDWEQEFDPGADDLPPGGALDARPPWEARPGARPAEPQDLAPTPAPWDLHPGEIGPAPEPPATSAPWNTAPNADPSESLDALRQQAGGWDAWDAAELPPEQSAAPAPFEAGDDLAWMRDFGAATEADQLLPADEDDLAWLGQIEPGQEPPGGQAPATARKIDTGELPWLDDETFRRIPEMEPEDEFALSADDRAAARLDEPPDDAFWLADEAFAVEDKPAEPAESIPDWLSSQFGAEAPAPEDAASPPAPPDTVPGVTRRLRPGDAEQALPEPPPDAPPVAESPNPIPGVTRRLRPQDIEPPAPEDSAPSWLSEADDALSAVEAGQPEALTFDEWERREEERAREARKSPEDRLLESVPDWFDTLETAKDAAPADTPEPPAEKSAEPDFMPGWFLGLEEQKTEDAPEWFQQLEFASDSATPPEPPAAAADDDVPDWFRGVEGPAEADALASAPGEYVSETPAPRPAAAPFGDWLADEAGAEDEGDFVERFDPLGAEDPGAATGASSVPDWLRDLEDEKPPDEAAWAARPALPTESARDDDSLDWLGDLSPQDMAAAESLQALFDAEADLAPAVPAAPELADDELEQLLDSYDAPHARAAPDAIDEWPGEETLAAALDQAAPLDAAPDLDSFFPDAGPGQPVPGLEHLFSAEPPSEGQQAPAAEQALQPDWVADLRPSDLPVTVHAAGVERDMPQTPVVGLPPRVHAFREKTLRDLDETALPPAPEVGVLAGLTGALERFDAALPAGEPSGPLSGAIVTREHQARVKKLQALLAAAEEPEEAAAADEAPGAQAAPGQVPRRARRPRRFKPDRVLIALLMLAALIAPFATDALHFAADPPPLGAAGEQTAAALDALAPGAYVLIAFEYGPTAAGELDALVEAVLRDAFQQGAIPLAISTNAAGALHAEAVFASLAGDAALLAARAEEGAPAALTAGIDYTLLGYLPGDALGVRTLAETYGEAGTIHPALDTDLRGAVTNLPIHALADDVALIVVAGEEMDDVRTWAEQLKSLPVPKVALVTAALEPLVDPYLYEGGYAGYLAGVRDTYTYNLARNANARQVYTLPDGLGFDIPNPEDARWHSMALGAAAAASLIALGMVLNLLRAVIRRRA